MITELKLTTVVKGQWYLLKEDLHFQTSIGQIHAISRPYARKAAKEIGCHVDDDLFITVPKGFMTDLASIPKLMHGVLPPDGDYAPAAVVHDFLYQLVVGEDNTLAGRFQSVLGQFGADRVLLLAMRGCGCSEALSTAFFQSVQLAGGQFYQRQTDAPTLNVDHLYRFANDYEGVRRRQTLSIPADHYSVPNTHHKASTFYPNCLRPFYLSEV